MVNKSAIARGRILALLRAGSDPVSGDRLAEALGVSRVAIWKQIEALKEAGYAIESGHSGYRLLGGGDFLYPWEFPGREARVVRFERTDSTMERALELALRKPEGAHIVVAETQTAGRGRRGRPWNSPPGGLFATIVLAQRPEPWRAERASLAGGIALCKALRELSGEPFTLEWPNDLYLARRKVAGILVEYLAEGDSVRLIELGLGVNVWNRAPGDGALSLAELPGPRPERRTVLSAFLDHLESIDLEWPGLAAAWNGLSSTPGKLVASRFDGSALGRALGVDDEGRLIVERPSGGRTACRSAEAHIVSKEHAP